MKIMKEKKMIKQTKQTLLVLGLALGLTNCASMVNQADKADRVGTAKVLGETSVARSSKECKNGAVVTYLEQHNLGHVDVIASAVLNETPFEEEFDLYALMGLRHTAFDPDVKYSKIEVTPPVAEVNVLLSHESVSKAPSNGADGRSGNMRAISADSASSAEVQEEPYALTQYKGLHGQMLYKLNNGEKTTTDKVVCSSKSYHEEAEVLKSIHVTLDGENAKAFALPTPILSTDVRTIPVAKGETGKTATIKIQPASSGSLYVMFNNMEAKGKAKRYEMQLPSPADGNVEIPLEDVPVGNYHLFLQRVEKNIATFDEDITACVDSMIFVETSMNVTKAEEEAKK